jgi:nucleoside 2-deoxyribosyltransferase
MKRTSPLYNVVGVEEVNATEEEKHKKLKVDSILPHIQQNETISREISKLNKFSIVDKGNYKWLDALTHGFSYKGAILHAYGGTNLKVHLKEIIRDPQWSGVVGCLAWFTNLDILEALAERGLPCQFVVQKEKFYNPSQCTNPSERSWAAKLRSVYSRLRPWNLGSASSTSTSTSTGIRTEIGTKHDDGSGDLFLLARAILQCCFDGAAPLPSFDWPATEQKRFIGPVSCVGNLNSEGDKSFPIMHHKYAVFFDASQRPAAVWMGSFNWTANGNNCRESTLFITEPNFALHMAREHLHNACLSEPLDWIHPVSHPSMEFCGSAHRTLLGSSKRRTKTSRRSPCCEESVAKILKVYGIDNYDAIIATDIFSQQRKPNLFPQQSMLSSILEAHCTVCGKLLFRRVFIASKIGCVSPSIDQTNSNDSKGNVAISIPAITTSSSSTITSITSTTSTSRNGKNNRDTTKTIVLSSATLAQETQEHEWLQYLHRAYGCTKSRLFFHKTGNFSVELSNTSFGDIANKNTLPTAAQMEKINKQFLQNTLRGIDLCDVSVFKITISNYLAITPCLGYALAQGKPIYLWFSKSFSQQEEYTKNAWLCKQMALQSIQKHDNRGNSTLLYDHEFELLGLPWATHATYVQSLQQSPPRA